jgi:hypothetical protein
MDPLAGGGFSALRLPRIGPGRARLGAGQQHVRREAPATDAPGAAIAAAFGFVETLKETLAREPERLKEALLAFERDELVRVLVGLLKGHVGRVVWSRPSRTLLRLTERDRKAILPTAHLERVSLH